MNMFYALVRAGLRRWLGMHPSRADWIAWQDKQLSVAQALRLEAHLKTCVHCQSENQHLHETFALFLKADGLNKDRNPSAEDGLVRLQENIQAWRETKETRIGSTALQPASAKERLQRVSAELEVYLGPQMTAQLMEGARQSGPEVRAILASARPLLTGLLGERAAFNVTTQLFKFVTPERTPA